VDTLNKNESRAALEKAVRVYCKAYLLYNPKVTGEERERVRLPVYSSHAKTPPQFAGPKNAARFSIQAVKPS
jgi:hypothetical protein